MLLLGLAINISYVSFFVFMYRGLPLINSLFGSLSILFFLLWDLYDYSLRNSTVKKRQDSIINKENKI